MDLQTQQILRWMLEIQLEQTGLLQRLVAAHVNASMDRHAYHMHDGRDPNAGDPELIKVCWQLGENQEKLRELIVELSKIPAPTEAEFLPE